MSSFQEKQFSHRDLPPSDPARAGDFVVQAGTKNTKGKTIIFFFLIYLFSVALWLPARPGRSPARSHSGGDGCVIFLISYNHAKQNTNTHTEALRHKV